MSAEEITTNPSQVPSGGPPVSAPAVAAAEAAPAPAAPASKPEKETLRETVTRAVATARVRDETGKFVSPKTEEARFPTPAAPSRPPMPKSLKQELAPHWDSAPPELLNGILEREAFHAKGIEPFKEKARMAEAVLNEFKPYEMLLKMENTTPERAIGPLLQTAAIFRTGTPSQKAYAVAEIMRQYSVSPEHVQQALQGQPPPQPAMDPQMSNLTQQVEQLKQFQQSQTTARAMTAIEQFSANPEHKYFDAVAEDMQDMIANSAKFRSRAAGLSEADTLKLAYDTAVYANPEVRTQMQADTSAAQQAKDQAKALVDKAKNAAAQVKGSPSVAAPPPADPSNRRATIAAAFAARGL